MVQVVIETVGMSLEKIAPNGAELLIPLGAYFITKIIEKIKNMKGK